MTAPTAPRRGVGGLVLGGYGPLVAVLTTLALLVALVPSKAPGGARDQLPGR